MKPESSRAIEEHEPPITSSMRLTLLSMDNVEIYHYLLRVGIANALDTSNLLTLVEMLVKAVESWQNTALKMYNLYSKPMIIVPPDLAKKAEIILDSSPTV